MTRPTMSRQQWELLSPLDRAAAARTMKITDAPRVTTPDATRLVYLGPDGQRTVYTRKSLQELPPTEQARIGRHLRVEHGTDAPDNTAAHAEFGAAIIAKLRHEGSL